MLKNKFENVQMVRFNLNDDLFFKVFSIEYEEVKANVKLKNIYSCTVWFIILYLPHF